MNDKMKLIIDIPKNYYQECIDNKQPADYITQWIKNGTPIPNNATNGDVIKIIFPQLEIVGNFETTTERIMVQFCEKDDTHDFKLDWWNAPYNKEMKWE